MDKQVQGTYHVPLLRRATVEDAVDRRAAWLCLALGPLGCGLPWLAGSFFLLSANSSARTAARLCCLASLCLPAFLAGLALYLAQ